MTELNYIVGDPSPITRPEQLTASDLQDELNNIFNMEIYALAWVQYEGTTYLPGRRVLLTTMADEEDGLVDTDELEPLFGIFMGYCGPDDECEDDFFPWNEADNYDTPAGVAVGGFYDKLISGVYYDVLMSSFGHNKSVIATTNEFIVRDYIIE